MKSFDPMRSLPIEESSVIFASAQSQGQRDHQEDCFGHFSDEFFAIADGVGGLAHGEVAAQLAVETAVWGYKHIRLRPFYWDDKRLFMKRIFRSVNIAVWQKHRETEFSGGLATTLTVVMIGAKHFWLGNVGDSAGYLYQANQLEKLTVDDSDEYGFLTNVLGVNRYGIVPHFTSGVLGKGDSILLGTDGLTRYASTLGIKEQLATTGNTEHELQHTCQTLISQVQTMGSDDNVSVCLVKRYR